MDELLKYLEEDRKHTNIKYIGDGLYASLDHLNQIWLTTYRDDGVHTVALEFGVYTYLVRYAEDCGFGR